MISSVRKDLHVYISPIEQFVVLMRNFIVQPEELLNWKNMR
jgi:hypothetical protein